LQLTRVQELLRQDGVRCSYMTLLRFVRRSGWGSRSRSTVRVAESQPGDVAEIDFGRMGMLLNLLTGKRQVIWALVVVLPFSRHCFVWLTTRQTLEATIEGLEAAWRFFGGVPHRVVLDNFPAAIAGPDALEPRPTRGFLEYSQARGFLLDPARVRHPKDKPHVERTVRYVRERFWKGGRFSDLLDARRQAQAWCLEVAGRRIHGSTGHVPLVVFDAGERAHLLPISDEPYDVPVRAGFDVLFSRADVLLKELAQARVDHTFEKTFRHFLAPDLLIVDDFGRAPRGAMTPRGLRDPPLTAAAVGRS
jgi:transposase